MQNAVSAALALGFVVFFSNAASAQSMNIDLKEEYIQTILAKGEFQSTSQDATLYTVPAKRRFRLTDVIVTNYSSQVCDYRIFVESSETNEFTVQPRSTFVMNFNTGLLFRGPTTVTMRNTPRLGGGTPCGLVTIMGVLTQKESAGKKAASPDDE